jgi:anti-sigma factor RsiW
MTSCTTVQIWLQLYCDGHLDPRRLGPLEAHMLSCDTCRREWNALEALTQSLAVAAPMVEPPDLTDRILARIAEHEVRRAFASAYQFSLRWSDAFVAALFATVSTLIFILLDPGLRAAVSTSILRDFPEVTAFLDRPGPGSIAWVAWLVWIAAGAMLALWFAGAEVRSSWRRSLSHRLPQLRQPW